MSSVKKIVKALRSEGLLRQKALALGIGLGHRHIVHVGDSRHGVNMRSLD
jgi:hypothetical protein